jgi:uncharacterized protein
VADRNLLPTQFDLRSLTGGEVRLERQFAKADLVTEADEFRLTGPATLSSRLVKAGDRYHLSGRVSGELELGCSRCLEPFRSPVDVDVELTYVPDPRGAKAAADEVELADEDLTTAYYRDQVLDLGDLMREQFYLALPMQPRCRDDCRGLCPHCGTNLNHGTCSCDVRWEDPRLAGLKALAPRPGGSRT